MQHSTIIHIIISWIVLVAWHPTHPRASARCPRLSSLVASSITTARSTYYQVITVCAERRDFDRFDKPISLRAPAETRLKVAKVGSLFKIRPGLIGPQGWDTCAKCRSTGRIMSEPLPYDKYAQLQCTKSIKSLALIYPRKTFEKWRCMELYFPSDHSWFLNQSQNQNHQGNHRKCWGMRIRCL